MRLLLGASESKQVTGMPLATALSMAGVRISALVQETVIPATCALIRALIASACFWAFSSGGVRQSMVISASYLALSSLAASLAPVCAATKTSLVWLLATIPITIFF